MYEYPLLMLGPRARHVRIVYISSLSHIHKGKSYDYLSSSFTPTLFFLHSQSVALSPPHNNGSLCYRHTYN